MARGMALSLRSRKKANGRGTGILHAPIEDCFASGQLLGVEKSFNQGGSVLRQLLFGFIRCRVSLSVMKLTNSTAYDLTQQSLHKIEGNFGTHAPANCPGFGPAPETRPKKRATRRRSSSQERRITRGGKTRNCSRGVRWRFSTQSSEARWLHDGRGHVLLCQQGSHGRCCCSSLVR